MTDRPQRSEEEVPAHAALERGVLVLAVGQALSCLLVAPLAAALQTSFLWAHATLFLWGATASGILLAFLRDHRPRPADAPAPPPPRGRRPVVTLPMMIPVGAFVGLLTWCFDVRWGAGTALPADPRETIRLGAILGAIGAFLLFFLGRWAHSVHRRQPDPSLAAAIHLNWVAIAAHLVTGAVLFLFLYTGRDLVIWTGRAIAVATLVLVADAVVGVVAEIYRPTSERGRVPMGRSTILDWTLSRANPLRRVAAAVEGAYGIRLGEIWAFRFIGRMLAPLAALGLLLAWLSSCLTIIPVESEGVRVRFGHFQPDALGPGPHVGLPWPFEEIVLVPTRRIETLHVGYDEDLGGPILWNERHYRGERNMLTGNGEELLTIGVFVHYRIRDPVAYLLRARAQREALSHIAHSELVRTLAARDSFGIMLAEREEIAERMRGSLQASADRFGLGLEIQFVGLRDIHPPVDVAPAFHAVVSAEQKRYAIVHDGERYRSIMIPSAEARSNKLAIDSASRAKARVAKGQGEAHRFSEIAAAYQAAPTRLRERAYLETMEMFLPGRPKVILDGKARATPPAMLYLPLSPGYSTLPLMESEPAPKPQQ